MTSTMPRAPVGEHPTRPSHKFIRLNADERMGLFACVVAVALATLIPHPVTKLVVGGGLALVFVLLSIRHFYIAIAFFVFFLPLQRFLPQESILIRGLNVQTLLVIYLVVLGWAARDGSSSISGAQRSPATAPLLCFVCILVVSAVHSALYPGPTLVDLLTRIKNWLIYSVFIGLTFTHIRDRQQKLFIILFAFVMVAFTAMDSLTSVLAKDALMTNPLRHRAGGLITPQPNLHAGFLALYLLFFVAFLTQYPLSLKNKVIVAGATAVLVANLVYTFSRGAWLAAAVAAVFVAGTTSRRLLAPVAVILLAVYLWAPEAAVNRFESGLQGEYDPSLLLKEDTDITEAASRIIQWRSFVPMLSANPILGVGLDKYAMRYYEAGYDLKPRSAHSSVIEIAVENGVFAIFCYFWLLFAIYRSAGAVFRGADDPLDRTLALGLMGATIALLLLDLTGTRFRNGDIIVLYWILAGMTLNSPVGTIASQQAAPSPRAAPNYALRQRAYPKVKPVRGRNCGAVV